MADVNNAAATDPDEDDVLSRFLAFTGHTVDANVARQYLEMSGNHLETAASLFVEVHGDDAVVLGEERGDGARTEGARAISAFEVGGDDEHRSGGLTHDKSLIDFLEADYDHLLATADNDQSDAGSDDVPSSPNYDYLGLDCDDELSFALYYDGDGVSENEIERSNGGVVPAAASSKMKDSNHEDTTKETGRDDECQWAGGDDDVGEEYILGTLMVRVLQAKNLKANPHHQGGGISGLLANHRRSRHRKSTMSPLSGGILTPSSNQQVYAVLSYRDTPPQPTSVAMEHAHGDYHWSRSDQSYFDVTCPAFPLGMGDRVQPQPLPSSSKEKRPTPSASEASSPRKEASRKKSNSIQRPQAGRRPPPPPVLQLSLYSKKSSGSSNPNKQNKCSGKKEKNYLPDKNDDYLLGKCSVNVLRILSGKTPYFDEWCVLHDDTKNFQQRGSSTNGASVRVVVEYEPSDPPPRPGDRCVFADVYPFADGLYPVPLRSARVAVRPSRSSSTLSSLTTESSPIKMLSSLSRRPKRYRVEEVVGDHVVLSYCTPVEGWTCTFEVHRRLLLCVERHQPLVEKYRERVLDLCDNVSQSPAMEAVVRTVEALPDEGLVHVGVELVGGGVGLLGRWWESGVEGLVEDVVDGINLDGRHSHLSVDKEEEDDKDDEEDMEVEDPDPPGEERKALPGMPCCPITGLAMVEPVVAADGHTYERRAIARWLRTSNRSPLTGEELAHAELVPNYLLLSSLGNGKEEVEQNDGGEFVNTV